jgi:hypothetical protein
MHNKCLHTQPPFSPFSNFQIRLQSHCDAWKNCSETWHAFWIWFRLFKGWETKWRMISIFCLSYKSLITKCGSSFWIELAKLGLKETKIMQASWSHSFSVTQKQKLQIFWKNVPTSQRQHNYEEQHSVETTLHKQHNYKEQYSLERLLCCTLKEQHYGETCYYVVLGGNSNSLEPHA